MIMAGFLGFGRDLSTLDASYSIRLFNRRKHDSLQAMISHKGRSITVLEFYTVEEKTASPWSIIGPKTHIPGDTASDASFDRVQEWIQDCVQHHSKCGPGPQTRLPSRVLDLGTSNNSIKLYETEASIGSYICLSHCWGAIPTIVTTTETLEAYRENIPWVSLPAVFRNAIDICRRLRVQYLWIDKLCIIQHDKEDWIREGSNMANIFENSFLTLAASTAADDSGKFFVQMDLERSKVVELTGSTADGKAYNIYARLPIHHYLDDDCPGSHTTANAPLLRRAWVFQERLLAPRVLHFGEELTWECREESYCECSGASHRMKIDHATSLLSKSSDSTLHDQWRRLVMRFTSLRLTHETDRLPALSGAAKQFQMRLRKRYLAGLWDDSLVEDLLW
ncbi:HET-domain-containing protein, partial [Hyaloscypha variabilis F]